MLGKVCKFEIYTSDSEADEIMLWYQVEGVAGTVSFEVAQKKIS